MSDKILFDADGVIGPSITLFLQINSLTNEEVVTIADILITNYLVKKLQQMISQKMVSIQMKLK